MNLVHEDSEAAILDRVFRPLAADWPAEAAEAILAVNFAEHDVLHMTQLLEKAKDGTLSAEDGEVLENYRHVGRLLELMKSRARHSLRQRS